MQLQCLKTLNMPSLVTRDEQVKEKFGHARVSLKRILCDMFLAIGLPLGELNVSATLTDEDRQLLMVEKK